MKICSDHVVRKEFPPEQAEFKIKENMRMSSALRAKDEKIPEEDTPQSENLEVISCTVEGMIKTQLEKGDKFWRVENVRCNQQGLFV